MFRMIVTFFCLVAVMACGSSKTKTSSNITGQKTQKNDEKKENNSKQPDDNEDTISCDNQNTIDENTNFEGYFSGILTLTLPYFENNSLLSKPPQDFAVGGSIIFDKEKNSISGILMNNSFGPCHVEEDFSVSSCMAKIRKSSFTAGTTKYSFQSSEESGEETVYPVTMYLSQFDGNSFHAEFFIVFGSKIKLAEAQFERVSSRNSCRMISENLSIQYSFDQFADSSELGLELGSFGNLKLYKNYLFLTQGINGVHIFDITDYHLVSHIDSPTFTNEFEEESVDWVREIEIAKPYAYIGTDKNGILVYDIKDIKNPQHLATFQIGSDIDENKDKNVNNLYEVRQIELHPSKPIAYIANTTNPANDFRIIDISDPFDLKELSRFRLSMIPTQTITTSTAADEVLHPNRYVNDFFIEYDNDQIHAYLASWENGLIVVDITNAERPKYITSITYENQRFTGNVVIQKFHQKKYAIVNDESFLSNITVLDVSDLHHVNFVTQYHLRKGLFAKKLSINGSKIYAASYNEGLQVFDFNERVLKQTSFFYVSKEDSLYSPSVGVWDIIVQDNTLFISDMENGLFVLRETDEKSE